MIEFLCERNPGINPGFVFLSLVHYVKISLRTLIRMMMSYQGTKTEQEIILIRTNINLPARTGNRA
jgi:hypothetical protein